MGDTKQEGRQSQADRLAARIEASLQGRKAGSVRLTVSLTGPVAETWRGIRDASEGLGLDDAALLTLLLEQGGATLRVALGKVTRPEPPQA